MTERKRRKATRMRERVGYAVRRQRAWPAGRMEELVFTILQIWFLMHRHMSKIKLFYSTFSKILLYPQFLLFAVIAALIVSTFNNPCGGTIV